MDNYSMQYEFIIVNKNCSNNCLDFLNLGYDYMKETAADYPLEVHEKFLNSILNKQGQKNRWLILLKVNNTPVGFVHAKIDEDERVGWGYILEFYIVPTYRRKGFGKNLYNFIKQKFIECGIENIWLSADRITGEPFWFAIGFVDTGEIENGHKVLRISI